MGFTKTIPAQARRILMIGVAALSLSGCASTMTDAYNGAAAKSENDLDAALAVMLSGQSQMQGEKLEAALEKASAFPLGSAKNPVRAAGLAGQRAYLSRLRCANLARPGFYRAGSAGVSPFGNIVDIYVVNCGASEPAESEVYIDMYHTGYVEAIAVPGYGIDGGRRE